MSVDRIAVCNLEDNSSGRSDRFVNMDVSGTNERNLRFDMIDERLRVFFCSQKETSQLYILNVTEFQCGHLCSQFLVNHFRCWRQLELYCFQPIKFSKPHIAAKVEQGRPDDFKAVFPRMSSAACLSWRIMIVCPNVVIELIGPYWSLSFSQCWYSGSPFAGKSMMLPRMGKGAGQGGSIGRTLLRERRLKWMATTTEKKIRK